MPSLDAAETADLRRRIVDAGIDAIRATGHSTVTLDDIARQADLEVAEVESAFPIWDLLMVSIIDGWVGVIRRDQALIAERDGAVAYVRSLVEAAASDPAMVRTRLAFIGAASDENHAANGWYRSSYAQFMQDVTLFFTRDIVAKREPRTVSPRFAAEQLIALYEGLQVQSTMLDTVDLLTAWDRAVGFLHFGWSEGA
ncbi:TetR/AcrR family transcriptional regulator [Frondihabitans australicus]|uniref:TetR family transcriptional regulator n=1 Tax=Frondihabitans australicus TaxID=386892 RepID=A0A495IBP5_9MICO|nr:TetR family transcriptional regulator C-terminal domain-containing protein [Frondihabitans australicus]RKR73414.1 TetR family transcriptional regulator [Frondihabitans australicus]